MLNQQVDILLVEDNQDDADLTIRALKKLPVTNAVLHVEDGAAALEFMFGTGAYTGRNLNNMPKIILLDLKMPKVNGMEVLEKIKANEATKSIPVIVLTSSAEYSDVKKCYALGANSYIVKSMEFDVFIKTLYDVGHYWLMLNKQ